jgi:riboflavin kinase/FMN adenylyltransferase
MKRIKSVKDIKSPYLVVFGNFDGVHRGHQYLVEYAYRAARELKAKLCLVTFSPHPKLLFQSLENFLLCSEDLKETYCRELDVDYYLELSFTKKMASLSPQNFLEKYIYSKKLKGITIGFDFAMGKNRTGNADFFSQYCQDHKIAFNQGNPIYINGDRCSSSLVRKHSSEGNMYGAESVLGRALMLKGMVKRGKGLGKTIGVPTINIYPAAELLIPMHGVYVTTLDIAGVTFKSITNVGINPTTDQERKVKAETHCLEALTREIEEGDEVIVHFYHKLRDEKKFDSIDLLLDQIKKDIEEAKSYEWS